MRKLVISKMIIVLITLLLIGCKSTQDKTDRFIPYLLPLETEKAIFQEISYLSSEKKIAFYFDFSNSGRIDIWVDTFSNGYNQTVKTSNRKIFINNKFYPLVFSLDEVFKAELKNGDIIVQKNCYYHKPDRKEIITTVSIPTLSEREKLFPYVDGEPCQISQRKSISMRHQGYLISTDLAGNIIEIDKRPDGLEKID